MRSHLHSACRAGLALQELTSKNKTQLPQGSWVSQNHNPNYLLVGLYLS